MLRYLPFLFLIGCNTDYVKPTMYQETVIINWHRTDNADDDCRDQGVKQKVRTNTLGCAKWRYLGVEEAAAYIKSAAEKRQMMIVCDIYAPQVQYDFDPSMGVLGHESNHCFTGKFHD